jgi:hypothetical protein
VRKIKLIYRCGHQHDGAQPDGASGAGGHPLRLARILGSVLHQLWLEVTGFTSWRWPVVGAVAAGLREYGRFQSGHATGLGRLLLAVCFTVSFAWFG